MCKFCKQTKRNNPSYIYCPYCGKSYNPLGFTPKYVTTTKYDDCDSYGRPKGLGTTTLIEIKR